MRIDLGCGKNKFRDCIGIDRIAYHNTDIVHDLNQPLPLEDNSVDFVMASRSLEYVDDLHAVMEDIYRVCRHKAVVCIVAPYAHVSSHMVNPQYKHLFNEHSPRYWTKHTGMALDSNEFLFSPKDTWSLRDEESSINTDYRVLRMEFFYFPQYRLGYEPFELSLLRQSQFNVAFQIMYQLLVVKEPIDDEEVLMLNETVWFEEPDDVKAMRSAGSWEEKDKRPFYLDHLSPILQDQVPQDQNVDIEFYAKKKIRKQSVKNHSNFKHRVKTIHKKRHKYTRSPKSSY
ncbi:methyltransferase domain-containing protein [Cohnella sp. REN36]|uniref:methyltransferase domain-containing protein n=1 Tax=Cohnella sp. REN36 TaxID=2887347 RepID=UPI001D14A53E|nr:methyltransferase domain-containing protein [Cohnella sp. REN36]MCC3371655.1 class I SAM-dependent methyltransferase [Cohnella sp. REN36]